MAAVTLNASELKGNPPFKNCPSSFAVDHASKEVFYNTYDENVVEHRSQIQVCDTYGNADVENPHGNSPRYYVLKVNQSPTIHLQDNIAHLPRPFGSPHRAEQLPSRFGGSMALWRSKEFDQRLLFIFGGQINGHDDNRVPPGEMSNDLVAIDVDRLRWWVVDVAGGAVAARKEAELVVVDDQIFLFGGTTLVDGGEKKIDSYSVCSLQAGQWRWEVRDEPYPAHVPATDNWRHVVVLQNQKVLMAKWRLEDSFILFDITSRTFERRAAVDFPQRPDYEWPNIRALPPNLTVGNSACAMAYTIDDKSPEVYIYSVQPPGWRSLQLGRQIAELQQEKKVKFELLITLGSKAYLFGWTEGSQEWDVFVEIPRQSMILNAH